MPCATTFTPKSRLTFSVVAISQVPTAPLVPMCAPDALDQALAAVCGGVFVVLARQAEALDPAARQADGEDWLGGVEDLCEEVGRQRQGAEVLQHGEGRGGSRVSDVGMLQLFCCVSAHVACSQFRN